MRKYQWLVIVMLIGCVVAVAGCKRMERMMAPVVPDPEPTVEPPVEMMPMDEGIGIFDTEVMEGHGLIAEAFYPGVVLKQLPDFSTLTPVHTWAVANLDVPHTPYEQGFPVLGVEILTDFAIRFRGQLKIETAGTYNFRIQVDDGAQVYINGELVVDNDGLHPFTSANGSAMLAAGYQDLENPVFPRTASFFRVTMVLAAPGRCRGNRTTEALSHRVPERYC